MRPCYLSSAVPTSGQLYKCQSLTSCQLLSSTAYEHQGRGPVGREVTGDMVLRPTEPTRDDWTADPNSVLWGALHCRGSSLRGNRMSEGTHYRVGATGFLEKIKLDVWVVKAVKDLFRWTCGRVSQWRKTAEGRAHFIWNELSVQLMHWAKVTWGHWDTPDPAPGSPRCCHHLPPANIITFKPMYLMLLLWWRKGCQGTQKSEIKTKVIFKCCPVLWLPLEIPWALPWKGPWVNLRAMLSPKLYLDLSKPHL